MYGSVSDSSTVGPFAAAFLRIGAARASATGGGLQRSHWKFHFGSSSCPAANRGTGVCIAGLSDQGLQRGGKWSWTGPSSEKGIVRIEAVKTEIPRLIRGGGAAPPSPAAATKRRSGRPQARQREQSAVTNSRTGQARGSERHRAG